MLDIIIRTCSKQAVETTEIPRVCGNNREEMILKCISSVVISANNTNEEVKIAVIDDHSTEEFLSKLSKVLDHSKHPHNLINLEEEGFNASAHAQFAQGLQGKELVYFIEDDYLHTPDAIDEMIQAHRFFSQLSRFNDVAIFPYDCPDRYRLDQITSAKIFLGGGRHWRTVQATSNTLLLHVETLKKHFDVFSILALEYKKNPYITEATTINQLYNNMVEYGGPINLFSPIPSLAVHLSYDEIPKIKPLMLDWEVEWNRTPILGQEPTIEVEDSEVGC